MWDKKFETFSLANGRGKKSSILDLRPKKRWGGGEFIDWVTEKLNEGWQV